MTTSLGRAPLWRDIRVGLVLPDRAFGAAVDIDGLLDEPELHYSVTLASSRLLLMPRAGSFLRLSLEWETLPEVGTFTARTLLAPIDPDPLDAEQIARLETWMRDIASNCHALRSRIRESAERVVRDASAGLEQSLPESVPEWAHVVSAQVGTRVTGPAATGPAASGVVDVREEGDELVFVERGTGTVLGRRRATRVGDQIVSVDFTVDDPRVGVADLEALFDQHIVREVLFDDVWQVYVHLLAGLEAPASVRYPGA